MLNILNNTFKSEMFITIMSGITVFILSQIIMEKIIKPRSEFKKIKGKIICYLTMHARYIANPLYLNKDKDSEFDAYWNSSCELRLIASELAGHIECYPIICNKKKYNKIVNDIIKISNNIIIKNSKRNIIEDNEEAGNNICKILKVKNLF